MNELMRSIIARIQAIPPLSPATFSLIEMLANDHFQMKELVRLIEVDLSLSTECLKTVNAASFGLNRPVDTIQRAVSFLGTRRITEIALRTGLGKLLRVKLHGYGAGETDLWEHSLKTALAARLISPHLDSRLHPELAYAAGLLHDLGKIVFSPLLERTIGDWATRPRQHDSFLALEQELLGSNHAAAGALLAEQWHLPATLTQAIAFHHAPSLCPEPNRNLALAVHLGDLLAMMCGSGCGIDCLYYQLDPLAQERLSRDSAWREEAIWKLILALNHEYVSAIQETEAAST